MEINVNNVKEIFFDCLTNNNQEKSSNEFIQFILKLNKKRKNGENKNEKGGLK